MDRKMPRSVDRTHLTALDTNDRRAADRRMFLDCAARYAAGGMAVVLGHLLHANAASAQHVLESERSLVAEYVRFPSPDGHGNMLGYLARPSRAIGLTFRAPAGVVGRRRPGVLVLHEDSGLTPYIEDVARRLTRENVLAFAPDALTSLGGFHGNEDRARELFGTLDPVKTREDFVAAATYLKTQRECSGRVAVISFGSDGGTALSLASRVPDLAAVVAFCGHPPATGRVWTMKAPLLLHYPGGDEGISAKWLEFEAALKAGGVRYLVHRYPGARDGFHDDTTPHYDEAAATLAWTRTVTFLTRLLRS